MIFEGHSIREGISPRQGRINRKAEIRVGVILVNAPSHDVNAPPRARSADVFRRANRSIGFCVNHMNSLRPAPRGAKEVSNILPHPEHILLAVSSAIPVSYTHLR